MTQTLSQRKQIAVAAREIYRVLFFAAALGFLVFGDYQLKRVRATPLYFFGGIMALGLVLTLKERLQTVIKARKSGMSTTQLIVERDEELRKKSREIKKPKPVHGRLRYLAAWTLPSIFAVPCLYLAILIPALGPPKGPNELIALVIIESFLLGIPVATGVLIYRRRIEAKRLGISLTDSMITMLESWEVRRQERLTRPSKLTKNQKYFWNAIGPLICIAVIASHLPYKIHYRFYGVFHREMLLGVIWLYAMICPLNLLSAYVEEDDPVDKAQEGCAGN